LHSHSLLLFAAPEIEDIYATDTLSLTDAITDLTSELPTTDTVTLTDAVSVEQILGDSFALTEADATISAELYPNEGLLLVEVAYRVQDETSIDAVALPHVLSLSIQESSVVQDLPVMDALPYRKQRGKQGRRFTIRGWTDSLSTLETLRGYADGEKHLLMLPTGDSMNVHVTDVRTPEVVENYDVYDYEFDALEVVD
jgi:hypothetical protein